MAAIEIDNLLDILQQKENDITVNDDTKEIIKILSAIKISKQQILRSYALLSELPNPSLINKGNIYYVEAENGLYVSTGAAWLKIESTSLSSFNVISGAPSGNGGLTYDNTTGEFIFNPADLSNKLELLDLSVCTNSANGVGNLSYNNHTGEFAFTPPDLSSYAVTGALSDFICLTDLNICTNTASGNGCLSYNNTTGEFSFTPADLSSIDVTNAICDFICLTDLSVCTNSASGSGALSYDNTTGEFAFTPADIDSCFANGSICNLYMTGTLCGPSTFTIDPAAHGDNTGTVIIAGNLQVDGTTTTVNSCTVEVADKNIVLSCGANNKVASDGAGITADLGSDGTATILYDATDDDWNFNKKVSVTGDIEATGSIIANGTTLGLGDNQKEFVATGAISTGEVVGLRNDGTVEVISYGPQIENVGTPEHLTAFTATTTATFDSSQNKVVIFYRNPSGNLYYGTAVVGTVDGTSITFGTPVVFNSANTLNIHSAFDSNSNKVVIAYRDGGNSSHGTAVVGTVSGTSITFGTPVVFESSTTYVADMTFDSNSNKVVIVWSGSAVVGTVSGTSISFGTSVTYSSGATVDAITFDSNSKKVVIGYEDSTSGYGTAVVGTVSGTSITFGTPAVYENGGINYNTATFDSNLNKVVFAYRNSSNTGSAVVGTVSGTSISFGTPVVFNSGYTIWNAPVFDPYSNQVIIAYSDLSNSYYGTLVVGTVSGTSISFGTPVIFNNANSTYIRSVFDTSQNKVVITYKDAGNNNYIAGIVYTPPGTFPSETNANSWIGIAAENIADTATGKIDLPGAINRSQTGLTPNSIYYVANDGSLTTTATQYGKIGRAYSATELQIFESYKQLNFASQLIFGN